MNNTSQGKFDIRAELRLIPKVMYVVALLAFLGIQALFIILAFRHDPHAPPVAVRVLIATIPGSILGIFLLLIGYVYRDAKRRGMNYVLWTILVIFIPYAIGYVIYFLIRQPMAGACPQCGATVTPAFNFCPKCKFNLHPACPQCHRGIEGEALFCPYCSADLKGLAPPAGW
jgi:RNA polymerase subunit RPABC4/transcription elongation factor Spt4